MVQTWVTSTKKHQVPRINIPILATKNFTLHQAMCIPQKCLVEFTFSKVISISQQMSLSEHVGYIPNEIAIGFFGVLTIFRHTQIF